MPAPAPAPAPAADSLRPISVYTYAPTPAGAKPLLPDALLGMFRRELSQEPHRRSLTNEQAQTKLRRLMTKGGVAIAWELAEPSVPVALAVCEVHRSDSVIREVDFPMTVLGDIHSWLGREEPFLVLTHLSVVGVPFTQRTIVADKLIRDATSSMMGLHQLTLPTILIPVSTEAHSPERQELTAKFGSTKTLLARDQRPGRNRELWGLKIRSR